MIQLEGMTLGQYHLMEQIGRGGMGTVYRAYQASLDRMVAVKVLPSHFAHDPDFHTRFRREATAIGKLRHPNILTVHDFGEENGLAYIAMEYVAGGTLKAQLGRPLSLVRTVEIVQQVAGALDCAHQQGIVHRDVKPANVLMGSDDWVLLSDFGVAKILGDGTGSLIGTGVGIGTPEYMSPEQAQGGTIDGRSDIYSLGIMLFHMLTGALPYSADTPLAVVLKHITGPLPRPRSLNPAISEAVERVILKALAKNPEDRYRTAGEMAQALKAAADKDGPGDPVDAIAVRAKTQVADVSTVFDHSFGAHREVSPKAEVVGISTVVDAGKDDGSVPEEPVGPLAKPARNWKWILAGVAVALLGMFGVFAGVAIYTNKPSPWQAVKSPAQERLHSVSMVSSSEGWAVGDDGTILHYTNGAWQSVPKPTDKNLESIHMVSSDEGWAVGTSGTILHFTSGVWQSVKSPVNDYSEMHSVFMVSPSEGWAVGTYGAILHYTNGVWEPVSSPTDNYLSSVFLVSPSEGWAVGSYGTILHYANGAWQSVMSPTSNWLWSVSMVSSSEGWAVGQEGTILHYSNGTWQPARSPTSKSLISISMVSLSEGWAVGGEGAIFHYTNGTWQSAKSPVSDHLYSVFLVSADEGWAVGSDGLILYYVSGNGTGRSSGTATAGPTGTSRPASPTATTVSTPAARKTYSTPPPMTIDQNKSYTAMIETTKGTLRLRLLPKEAPKTVNNFVFLAREGFYDGLTFHRAEPQLIQGGDPSGLGSGGPGYRFEDELPKGRGYKAGTLAMANSGPNTNGSQFFITKIDWNDLPKNYSIFGEVTEGLDVARNIYKGDLIRKVTIEEK